jgi:hypothetical protein
VIGKVIRGTDVRRLLYYLYGPGRVNEHADPHLVAGFGDPAELEPERRPGGTADVRRLAGLLNQPLAALIGPGYGRPVWHCALRAAPGDRELSDQEWAQVAGLVMDRTGLAPADDEYGVRWVAVRHAADHVHLVATLARTDGTRPKIWNDFYRVREACRDAEERLGLAVTAPADRTAARRPARAETQQAARNGWTEVPRTRLRREVSAAAATAATEHDFFARLAEAGVLVRHRYSTTDPGQVTGYAVGLPGHDSKDGGTVWYGGGKLAADLTLPKLRHRWTTPGSSTASPQAGLPPAGARAALRTMAWRAAGHAADEPGYFAELRACGAAVRLRFSQVDPGQVTGYSLALPGHPGQDGELAWHGGGRLAESLSLPRLRRRWSTGPERSPGPDRRAVRCSVAERNLIYDHAARQAAAAADQVRRHVARDPGLAADAAHAAADALHVLAALTGNPALRQAADSYDRAARMGHGRIPAVTRQGTQLRAAARLLALTGRAHADSLGQLAVLAAQLAVLADAVAGLRRSQQHATQAAAARASAECLLEARDQITAQAAASPHRAAARRTSASAQPELNPHRPPQPPSARSRPARKP